MQTAPSLKEALALAAATGQSVRVAPPTPVVRAPAKRGNG
jgi:hypothetical protein